MVESGHVFAFLIIIILVLAYGYAITPHNDPIIGNWQHTFESGGYITLSINSNGKFDELSFSQTSLEGIRRELAPIQGNWTRQLNGTYDFVHGDGFIQVWTYSPSQDVIRSENYENVTFSRT